jgi:hypothetical protein
MSDGNDGGNVRQHPASALKRRIEILEMKVRALEKDRDYRARVDLIMLQKYEELKDIVSRALTILADLQAKDKGP